MARTGRRLVRRSTIPTVMSAIAMSDVQVVAEPVVGSVSAPPAAEATELGAAVEFGSLVAAAGAELVVGTELVVETELVVVVVVLLVVVVVKFSSIVTV